MAKYLQRSCPKCNGYLGIVVPEPVRAINGRCLKIGYPLALIKLEGKKVGKAITHFRRLLFAPLSTLSQSLGLCIKGTISAINDIEDVHQINRQGDWRNYIYYICLK